MDQIEENFDEEDIIQGNSLAAKVMKEIFQKKQEAKNKPTTKTRTDEEEQKES